MIGRELKTEVDIKHLGSKVTFDKELFSGERYVYRVKKDNTFYILKGYQILLEHLKPGDEVSRQRFIKVLSAIAEAYQEYFFSRIACVFSQHFSKPLEIDQYVELTSDENSLSYLYIEILFEYSGEPLNTLGNLSIDAIYNLMRQSTSALTLLHNTGLMHLDIKPSNMMYNKETNLLKMMDVGTSFGYGTHSIIYKPAEDFKHSVRQFTREFAPPEILKDRGSVNLSVSELLIGNADVYCWAMCFYAMLLGKSVAALIHEANFYKLNTEESYSKFISATHLALENIPIKELKEKKKKEFIIEQICRGLNLDPKKRQTIYDIQKRMKEFEKKESIEISYYRMEKDYEGRMMKLLMIDNDERPNGHKTPSVDEKTRRKQAIPDDSFLGVEVKSESKKSKDSHEKEHSINKFSPAKYAESHIAVSRSNMKSINDEFAKFQKLIDVPKEKHKGSIDDEGYSIPETRKSKLADPNEIEDLNKKYSIVDNANKESHLISEASNIKSANDKEQTKVKQVPSIKDLEKEYQELMKPKEDLKGERHSLIDKKSSVEFSNKGISAHKDNREKDLFDIENLLGDDPISSILKNKEQVVSPDKGPQDDEPKMPIDVSPQVTPSDDVIPKHSKKSPEVPQFSKKNLYEELSESTKKEKQVIDPKTIPKELNPVIAKASESRSKPIEPKEEKKTVIKSKVCQDCIKGDKSKAILVCNHTVCEECLTQFAANCFANNMAYRYCAFCSTCKKAERISNYFSKCRKHYIGM